MIQNEMKNEKEDSNESFVYTLSLISGKWKLHILFLLLKQDIMRYGELKRALEGITHKMLSNQLKELESDSLITRREYSQVPPKVEYYLSERGKSLIPALQLLCKWGVDHMDDEY
ncbi:helix-turn-helix transcriptional regulator [Paenibacillus hunanensis]|uniref:winged helix-turn-helix transcriptional regulator n=1 Tax=Paenibacillus hunanensis TaxID=539262 RepID=UPI002027665F|nr:helix-turn-helix domain-containing protein [Paenibacillus hunanensis]MCL9659646.1 helix-turn-helix transcriptional regulator [Paenibacillus hunanensis]